MSGGILFQSSNWNSGSSVAGSLLAKIAVARVLKEGFLQENPCRPIDSRREFYLRGSMLRTRCQIIHLEHLNEYGCVHTQGVFSSSKGKKHVVVSNPNECCSNFFFFVSNRFSVFGVHVHTELPWYPFIINDEMMLE